MENDEEFVKEVLDFVGMMLVVVILKICVIIIVYLYEVVRIRLCEEGIKYRFFF